MRYVSPRPALYASPLRPCFEEQRERRDHVAHVGDVAAGRQVAGLDDGRLLAGLGGGDLAGEVRGGVFGALPRADLVEEPDADDVEAGVARVLVAQDVGRGLARGVGSRRFERGAFVAGAVRIVGLAVDQAGGDEENARPQVRAGDGVVERAGAPKDCRVQH